MALIVKCRKCRRRIPHDGRRRIITGERAVMNGEKIKDLETKEAALTVQTIEGARAGAVPPSLRRELEEVRAKLKAARRVRAMDAKRVDPKLTRRIGLLLPEDEYQALIKKVAESGVDLSKYIRSLLKSGGA